MGRTKGGSGVEKLAKKIRIKFYINGEMFRETLDLVPSPPNVKYAERLKKEIDAKIEHGVFDYVAYFPKSNNLVRLGLSEKHHLFRTYAELWFSTKAKLAKGTRVQYRRYLDSVWLPQFGERDIAKILPSEVEAFVATRDWGSAKNMNNNLSALRGPFQLAFKDRVIPLDPSAGVENMTYSPPGADPLTLDEVDCILVDMWKHYPEQIGNYFELAFFTGMRPEEQIAIQWPDIDWRMELLRVDKAVSYGELKGTKTGRNRDIELNVRALKALSGQKKHTFMSGQHVFLSPVTRRPYPSSQQLRDTYWKSSLKRTGIRGRDMYQTRHTFATLNLMLGANTAWLARQMGHSVRMLLTVYTKWIDGGDGGGNKALMNAALGKKKVG